jgi:molybdenum ABC transporter, periplasmic molybdate-binding protein
MNTGLRLALALLGVPVLPTQPAEPAPSVVNVFAAASLTEAFGEIGRTFEQDHPGMMVQFNFAGSQQLALQMEQGAPADVFASADQRWMDYVKDKDLIEGEAPVFARNRLVVIVPKTNPARIRRAGGPRAPGHEDRPVCGGRAGGQVQPRSACQAGDRRGVSGGVRPPSAGQRGLAGGEREERGGQGAARRGRRRDGLPLGRDARRRALRPGTSRFPTSPT